MANVLTTGVWPSTPSKKPSLFARLLRAQVKSRQRQADRIVASTLPRTGCRSCQTMQNAVSIVCCLKGGSSHGHTHDRARGKQARPLRERRA